MHDADIVAEAARQCIRLGMGLTTPDAVVRWADEVVLAQSVPSEEVFGLASAFGLPAWAVLERAKALTTREALLAALREVMGEVCSLHAQGALALRDGVERLLGWARAFRLWEDGTYRNVYWTLAQADIDLSLADTGDLQRDYVERSVLDDLARLAAER
jgi:hypothetical protein